MRWFGSTSQVCRRSTVGERVGLLGTVRRRLRGCRVRMREAHGELARDTGTSVTDAWRSPPAPARHRCVRHRIRLVLPGVRYQSLRSVGTRRRPECTTSRQQRRILWDSGVPQSGV